MLFYSQKTRDRLYQTSLGYAVYKSLKYFYYGLWGLGTGLNHYITKYKGIITGCYAGKRLHLGCGTIYLDGWLNIDNYIGTGRKKDIWLDITDGLPFKNSEIEAIFTSHTLEHFIVEDVLRILKESYRILKPNGYIRISVPSMTVALNAYVKGDIGYFKSQGKTINRKFIEYILWHGTHRTMFDFGALKELLEEVGFREIKEVKYRESKYFTSDELVKMDNYESESMFVECVK